MRCSRNTGVSGLRLVLVLALGWVQADSIRTLVSKTRLSDLDGSASEYVYHQHQHQHLGSAVRPVSYVQYATSHENGARVSYPAYPNYPDYSDYANYGREDYGGEQPLAPYYLGPPPPPPPPHLPLTRPVEGSLPFYVDYQRGHRGSSYHEPYHSHDQDESFEADGVEGEAEAHSAHGERGEEAYTGRRDFEQDDNNNRISDHHQGNYENEVGHKSGHEESGSRYDAHDHGVAQHEGSSHSSSSFHKKGQKTTGYHKVYHKDEYKKDTDFYDEEHNGGHDEKYGAHEAHRENETAGHEKAAEHDSGYQQGHQAHKGHRDRATQSSAHKGHGVARGLDAYNRDHADYATKADVHHSSHSERKRLR